MNSISGQHPSHCVKCLNSTELHQLQLRLRTEERCRLTYRDYSVLVLLVRANACLSTAGCAQMCLLPPDVGKLLTGFRRISSAPKYHTGYTIVHCAQTRLSAYSELERTRRISSNQQAALRGKIR